MEYGEAYYRLMQRQNGPTAAHINRLRWDLLRLCAPSTVLDYGCGCGYLGAHAPLGILVDTFDIGRLEGGESYPQTGMTQHGYDAIALFDVLEHVDWEKAPDARLLRWLRRCDYAAVTVPICPADRTDLGDWKHYKPGEHLTYFTIESLMAFFDKQGFEPVHHDTRECPPREDVHSFLFAHNDDRP